MICISLIPLLHNGGRAAGIWAADGKLTFPEFCSILQAPLRHQTYSFPGMSRDLEYGYPIHSLSSLDSWLGPGIFERANRHPLLG